MKKILSIILALCMMLTLMPSMAYPAFPDQLDLAEGSITIDNHPDTDDTLKVTYGGVVYYINTSDIIDIRQTNAETTTPSAIVINADVTGGVNIKLSGVNIQGSKAALTINGAAGKVNLILADGSDNKLKGAYNYAGLQKNNTDKGDGGLLTISCESADEPEHTCDDTCGKLAATGNGYGAGIGGGDEGAGGHINIYGGNITAAAIWAAGIGGGNEGAGSHINIYGGNITATGGGSGAGIGGSGERVGTGSYITISGGIVNATGGGVNSAGIGGGYKSDGSNITISGGVVNATGVNGGAGIGGGGQSYGSFSDQGGAGRNITISGGTVTATSVSYGIGGGGTTDRGESSNIVITGGNINTPQIGITPRNGSGTDIYKATFTIPGDEIGGTSLAALSFTSNETTYSYNMNDTRSILVDGAGKLFVYLPEGTYNTIYSGITYKAEVVPLGRAEFILAPLAGTATISNTTPRIGSVLNGSLDGGNNTGMLTYVWKVGDTQVGTGASYTVTAADLGKTITLEINSSVQSGTLTSAPTAAVAKKVAPSAPGAPTLASKTHDTVTLTANAAYEFSKDGSTWHTGNVFNSLNASTAYTFYQRVAETADTESSAASASLSVTTNSNGGGGGSGSGGSSSNDNGGLVIVIPPAPDKPNSPTQGEIKVPGKVDGKGNITVNVTARTVTDAFDEALADAKRNGNEQNGIAVVLHVDTDSKTGSNVTINLPKIVQDTIIKKKIVNTIVVLDNPDIRVGMDLATVKEINKQAKSDVNITANPMDSGKLTGDAKIVIGSRPVFDLRVNYSNDKQVQSFGAGSVSVTIPYTLGANEKAGNVQAVYVDGTGKVHWLANSVYDTVEKVLRFSTDHFSTYGVGYKQASTAFADIASHWAKEDIEFVVSRGLFSGTSTTIFSPNTTMTRGMFVTALGRLANTDVNGFTKNSFTDVKSDAYYMGYVEWASKNSIVSGTGNGKFAPDQSITREQMVVIMSNYAKTIGYTLPKVHAENIFADNVKISAYSKEAVKQMQMAGVINGKNSNLFDPQGTATRAEVSAVLRRYVELVISGDTI